MQLLVRTEVVHEQCCLSFGAGACLVNVNATKELIFIFAQRSSRTCRFVKPFALFSLQYDSTFLFFW